MSVEVRINGGVGTPMYCEPLLNEHPVLHGDLSPEEEEEIMRELADVLEYLDETEYYIEAGNELA